MSKRILILIFTLCSVSLANAEDSGLALYQQQKYLLAKQALKRELESQGPQANLLLLLALTEYQLHERGQAVRDLRHTLNINPTNQTALQTLSTIRKEIKTNLSRPQPLVPLVTTLNDFSMDLLALIFAGLTLVTLYFTKRRGLFKRQLHRIFAILTLLVLTVRYTSHLGPEGLRIFSLQRPNYAVVVCDQTQVFSAPQTQAQVIEIASAGTEASIIGSDKTFLNILLPSGRTGWVTADAVSRI